MRRTLSAVGLLILSLFSFKALALNITDETEFGRDVYKIEWQDDDGLKRTLSLVKTSGGTYSGTSQHITYYDGNTLVDIKPDNPNDNAWNAGFGSTVHHSGTHKANGTLTLRFQGSSHAIFDYTQTVGGAPETITWTFMDGNDYFQWQNTVQATATTDADSRGPYATINWDGSNASFVADGVEYAANGFFSMPNITSASGGVLFGNWTCTGQISSTSPNGSTLIPYCREWHAGKEFGFVQTQTYVQQLAGDPSWKASANLPTQGTQIDGNVNWAADFQMNFYDTRRKMTWGMPYGYMSGKVLSTDKNGKQWDATKNGWGQYSLSIMFDTVQENGAHRLVDENSAIQQLKIDMSLSIGSKVIQGPVGTANPNMQSLVPQAWDHNYRTWWLIASNNSIAMTINTNGTTLQNPTFRIKSMSSTPATIIIDGVTLNAGTDFYTSHDPKNNEVWLTLNQTLNGGHSVSLAAGGSPPPPPPPPDEIIQIDVNSNVRAIDPRIYGLAYASAAQLADLNCPLTRWGGNTTSRYNWKQNADNRASDWYYESIAYQSTTSGAEADSFIQAARSNNAEPMLTIPMLDWVAKVGANRSKLASFSVAKYGPQTSTDSQWMPDAGNGILQSGGNVVGNNKNDANVPAGVSFQRDWVKHLINRWGSSASGGQKVYILGNEYGLWHSTHRDVHPTGATMEEIRDKMLAYARMIKDEDPGAKIAGPETWGWAGYLYSGFDLQWGEQNGWGNLPDRSAHGGNDYIPWLLAQLKQASSAEGRALLDQFTIHYYPQGGEYGNDISTAMQLRRNRSTRSLWDPNYVDESWINDRVRLIPRMREWVSNNFPGLDLGITEYSWGAENHINGATTQADILGIFGREGLDIANRWTTPATSTPTYLAMKMYRNYDGQNTGFGETSVGTTSPNADELSAFASVRSSDEALTVMLVNKILNGSTQTSIQFANFNPGPVAQVWQLTSANVINRITDTASEGGSVSLTLPAQSITLVIIPKALPSGNNAPLAMNQNLSTSEDQSLNLQLSATDQDGDNLTYAIVTAPKFGKLSGAIPDLIYTPDPNSNNSDSFSFKANDGLADSNTATVSISVTPKNDAPTLSASATPTSGSAPLPVAFNATGLDIDGDELVYLWHFGDSTTSSIQNPNHTYTENDHFTVTVTASDGNGGSATNTLIIQVIASPNASPQANDQNVTLSEDESKSVLLTGTDADGDTLDYIIVTAPTHGSLSGNTPNVLFTPDPDFNGIDSFAFKVNDGTSDSNVATISLNITSVNDLPMFTSPPTAMPRPALIGEQITFTAGASDVDGDSLTYSWDWGDGSQQSGNPLTHSYSSAGEFIIKVTVFDSQNSSTSQLLTLTVNKGDPNGDTGNDNGDGGPADEPRELALMVFKARIRTDREGSDVCLISGQIPDLPRGFIVGGQALALEFGGKTFSFVCDAKGRGKSINGTLKMRFKKTRTKKGTPKEFPGGPVTFLLRIKRQHLAETFQSLGLDPSLPTSSLNLDLEIRFASQRYQATPILRVLSNGKRIRMVMK